MAEKMETIQDKLAKCQANLARERSWRKELQGKDQALRRRKALNDDWYKKWANARGPITDDPIGRPKDGGRA